MNKFRNNLRAPLLIGVIVLVLLILLGLLFSNNKTGGALCKNCNVIFIDLDVLRADAIDCKNSIERTPNICKFASQSSYFRNNASQSDLTLNSMVSLLTSLYPISHGVWNDRFSTSIFGVKYLPEILSANGYRTVLLEDDLKFTQVVKAGFEDVRDVKGSYLKFRPEVVFSDEKKDGKPVFIQLYVDELHFPYLVYSDRQKNPNIPPQGVPKTSAEFWKKLSEYIVRNYKNIFTAEAIAQNRELFSGNLKEKENEMLELFDHYAEGPEKTKYLKDYWGPIKNAYFDNVDINDSQLFSYLKESYLQTLSMIDKNIAPLLDYLEKGKMGENTIIIVSSNHGEEFHEHGGFSHENKLYQELIHTPLIIRVPGVKPAEINGLTEDIDIMPTILSLVGIAVPSQAQGKSLVPLMTNSDLTVRDYQIAQKGSADYFSVFRKGDWKLIMMKGYGLELYNLAADPGEQNNVIKAEPDLANQLQQQYRDFISELRENKSKEAPLPTWIDEQKRERLKNEGYF